LSNAQQSSTLDSANTLYFAGDFARAALEYERVIFDGEAIDHINTALFGRAQCFKQLRQFDRASDELSRIRLFTLNPSQTVDYYYEKILCNYLNESFIEARGEIEEMYFNIADSSQCNVTLILQTLVYNELQQWDQAKQTALLYAHTLLSPQKEDMETAIYQLYAKKNLPKLKKKSVSQVLAFVPGLAHIYAGYWAEGSVSFLLNSAILAFGVHQVWNGYYLTGYLLGAGTLSATYFGGFSRSSYLLQKRNYKRISTFNNQIKNELLAP